MSMAEVAQVPSFSGWLYTYPSEKYEFVNWDDDIPNIWKHTIHVQVSTNQVLITINYY